MKLTEKALLVQLNISQWSARKLDKRITKEVAQQHGVAEFVGNYNKGLLPMNKTLEHIHKMSTFIRQEFYKNTLPWGLENTHMLPTKNYMSFMTKFRSHKNAWEQGVTQFLDEYEDAKTKAQQLLGSLYNEKDYPTVDELRDKFRIEMVVLPVPSNDFRVELAEEEVERIQHDVEARVKAGNQHAMNEAWQRLYNQVSHIADKLSNPRSIFRDSMIENTRELCALLSKLNVEDNPELELMRKHVEDTISKYHPQALRNDPELREQTAAHAQNIKLRITEAMQS